MYRIDYKSTKINMRILHDIEKKEIKSIYGNKLTNSIRERNHQQINE